MSPEALVDWLTKLGPWAVAGIVAYWLYLERKERINAQAEAKNLRIQIADERKETAMLLAELGEKTRDRMRELTDRIGEMVKSGKTLSDAVVKALGDRG